MKLGFLSAILPDFSFEQVIDFAAENGFACVELACWPTGKSERRYAGVSHIDMAELDAEKASYIREYCQKRQVEISGIGYYPNPLSEDLEQRKAVIGHLKACIAGARVLGVPVVNTFVGRNRLAKPEENWTQFKAVWPELIRCAEANHVKIGIENCPMFFKDEWPNGDNLAGTPAFWRKMFQEIPRDAFGLNYDPSHLIWQRMDYIKPIYHFQNKLYHFHIKDAKFYQDKYDEVGAFAPPSDYHAPKLPGQGDIRWGDVIAALNDVGYDGPVVIEVEDRAYEGSLASRLNAILLSRDFMRQYIRSK